jgi:hypothetical protein
MLLAFLRPIDGLLKYFKMIFFVFGLATLFAEQVAPAWF